MRELIQVDKDTIIRFDTIRRAWRVGDQTYLDIDWGHGGKGCRAMSIDDPFSRTFTMIRAYSISKWEMEHE